MSKYLEVKEYARSIGLTIIEDHYFNCSELKGFINGRYVYLSNKLITTVEKYCTLCEEIAHYIINSGDITDLADINNRKQEILAHRYAIREFMVSKEALIEAVIFLGYSCNFYTLACELGVTEEWLKEIIYYYRTKSTKEFEYKGHVVNFDPFFVIPKDEIA